MLRITAIKNVNIKKIVAFIVQEQYSDRYEIVIPYNMIKDFNIQGPKAMSVTKSAANGYHRVYMQAKPGYHYMDLHGCVAAGFEFRDIERKSSPYPEIRYTDASRIGSTVEFIHCNHDDSSTLIQFLNDFVSNQKKEVIFQQEKRMSDHQLKVDYEAHREYLVRIFREVGIGVPPHMPYEGMMNLLRRMRNMTDNCLNVPGRSTWNGSVTSDYEFNTKNDD